MKKIIPLLLCLVMLLCGCSSPLFVSSPRLPDFNSSYTMTAKISGSTDCTADLTRKAVNQWTVSFAEPYALVGVTLQYDGGELSAAFDGISCTGCGVGWEESDLCSLIAVLECAANDSQSLTVTSTAQGVRASGSCSAGSFTLELNENGELISVSVDKTGIRADVTELAYN